VPTASAQRPGRLRRSVGWRYRTGLVPCALSGAQPGHLFGPRKHHFTPTLGRHVTMHGVRCVGKMDGRRMACEPAAGRWESPLDLKRGAVAMVAQKRPEVHAGAAVTQSRAAPQARNAPVEVDARSVFDFAIKLRARST
jgi:hypothetical protein